MVYMIHELPKLNYSYGAFEPFIDAKTMEIHYLKHHQAYVNKLNDALKDYPEWRDAPLEKLIKSLDLIPETIKTAVRNNAGGHFNHSFFWKIIGPREGGEFIEQVQDGPSGKLEESIKDVFGSFSDFKSEFSKQANNLFGSGWVWLVIDKSSGKIKIVSTQGHDNPLVFSMVPLLVLDVWEHAYYLKYQNRRPEYVEAWWNIVNWKEAEMILNGENSAD